MSLHGPSQNDQSAPGMQAASCKRCAKPTAVCVCADIVMHKPRRHVLILQHPQEQDFLLGSARLATLCLEGAQLRCGLSWPSLAQAWGSAATPRQWAVLYPNSLPRPLTAEEKKTQVVLMDSHGKPAALDALHGIVLLDGTWSQAKALWWRNPWLLKLPRLLVQPREPSIYGRLRREPQRHCVSTLEAIAETLPALGEPEAVRQSMRRLFRTMVQRVRDQSK